jgi:hypothetical protein
MLGSTSNLSVDEQQTTATKRKEDDAAAVAQATVATTHREQESLIATVTAARKTLEEARVTVLAWEKEKTITRHLEQQLAATHGITIPQDDDDDRSIDAGSNPDAGLIAHLHVQAVGLQNIRSMITIVLEPSSLDYKWCHDLMLLTLRHYALDDHVLSDVVHPSIY